MKHIQKGLILLLFCSLPYTLFSFDLTKINLDYHYAYDDLLRFDSRIISSEEVWEVYISLEGESLQNWSPVILSQSTYRDEDHDTLSGFDIDTLLVDTNKLLLKYEFSKSSVDPLLIYSFVDTGKGSLQLFDVFLDPLKPHATFCPLDQNGFPILTSFVNQKAVKLPGSESYHVYEFGSQFGPADPPMGQMKPISPSLDVDSSYFLSDSLSALKNEKFYLIQKDTLENSAVTLLKVPPYFPKMRRLEELISPMTYITTSAEYRALQNGSNQKKTFETFWINTFGTRLRAKSAIKNYFDRIEKANALFTTYKQGWKTDRGIIYIIYGNPQVVIKSDRSEVWKYEGAEYEFVKISTLFAPTVYSLKRDKKYEKEWYRQVGALRKGNG